ncbi:hypothetical protein ETT45_01880 [Streptococcus pyogenes]|uniref:hypothetical protein n=1 Tax=Streptococcus pyogenes TaxID=1314 RepID=UPI00109D665A|nr:hypothetical protein [Streptococcus pyogenes]QCK72107.1 hypothetical protein ETT45_01880 [Streptococcus pyogenes]VGU53710.1 hypothetical membrane associated protein [Streptococcus pyogenes]VGX02343.1 Uncharacterised protein [Streptococcus pyogenes]VGX06660.1 Uncharacterised protein [Streptococcus pyogenes]VGX07670.1 Uncharacterised protein [Streptococcus pyogenes]
MKTKKSKRFLNLATLCLALLGTTLLMGRPVKAEAARIPNVQQGQSDISNNTRENGEQDDESGAKYAESYRIGNEDGYKAGKKATPNDTLEREDIKVPDPDKLDPEGYKDGYEGGFWKGFNEVNHPILTAIEGFLSWLWGLFTTNEQ